MDVRCVDDEEDLGWHQLSPRASNKRHVTMGRLEVVQPRRVLKSFLTTNSRILELGPHVQAVVELPVFSALTS